MTSSLTLALPLQLLALWLPEALEKGCTLTAALERAVGEAGHLPPLVLTRQVGRALGPSQPQATVPVTLRLGPWAFLGLQRQAAAWDLSPEQLALIHLGKGPQGQAPRTQMA